MQRSLEAIEVGLEDFHHSDWNSAIASSQQGGYHALWQALSAVADAAIAAGKPAEGKVLTLLGTACSMMLNPRSTNEPFKPVMTFGNSRTALPDDFEEADIEFFSLIVEDVPDPWLQARLADLLWLLERPKQPRYALLAIDAYRRIPLDAGTWRHGGQECWQRAITLARMLRAGAGERMNLIETQIVATFEAVSTDQGIFALWLADLLSENGLARSEATDVAGKLEMLAQICDAKSDTYCARALFLASARWFGYADDAAKSAEMTAGAAETWVKEAATRQASAHTSHMASGYFYEKAIQTYRSIPRAQRSAHGVDERIAELRSKLSESGAHALDDMGHFTSHEIDITRFVESARAAVTGKRAPEALAAFSDIRGGIDAGRLRESAIQTLQDHPLLALISSVHYSRDGRVVARSPGLNLNDLDSAHSQAAVWAQMIREYLIELSFRVRAVIWPAYEVLVLEHRLRERDFIVVADHSAVVPLGREHLFGKALFAGYDGDFVSSLHLLVPQIEHMVRVHLQAAGANTTVLDAAGIETEIGLSALLDLPQANEVLGDDLCFELRAIFCDPLGPNLRNELAHGLLDHGKAQSEYAVYAWWLGMRLVFNGYWRSIGKTDTEAEDAND